MLKRKKERNKVAPSGVWTHAPQFQCSLRAILAYLNTLQSGGNALPMVYLKVIYIQKIYFVELKK
jgi:hypothetical protein